MSVCSLQPNVLRILCPTAGFPVAAGLFLLNFAAGELTVGTVFKLIDYKGAVDFVLVLSVCLHCFIFCRTCCGNPNRKPKSICSSYFDLWSFRPLRLQH